MHNKKGKNKGLVALVMASAFLLGAVVFFMAALITTQLKKNDAPATASAAAGSTAAGTTQTGTAAGTTQTGTAAGTTQTGTAAGTSQTGTTVYPTVSQMQTDAQQAQTSSAAGSSQQVQTPSTAGSQQTQTSTAAGSTSQTQAVQNTASAYSSTTTMGGAVTISIESMDASAGTVTLLIDNQMDAGSTVHFFDLPTIVTNGVSEQLDWYSNMSVTTSKIAAGSVGRITLNIGQSAVAAGGRIDGQLFDDSLSYIGDATFSLDFPPAS